VGGQSINHDAIARARVCVGGKIRYAATLKRRTCASGNAGLVSACELRIILYGEGFSFILVAVSSEQPNQWIFPVSRVTYSI